ncbi:hypothetical protein [Candidatus Raskinella chloraquaticus]
MKRSPGWRYEVVGKACVSSMTQTTGYQEVAVWLGCVEDAPR